MFIIQEIFTNLSVQVQVQPFPRRFYRVYRVFPLDVMQLEGLFIQLQFQLIFRKLEALKSMIIVNIHLLFTGNSNWLMPNRISLVQLTSTE